MLQLKATEAELEARKAHMELQDQYAKILEGQRDRAVQQLKDQPNGGLPWYFWGVLGVAGGVILTRGLR